MNTRNLVILEVSAPNSSSRIREQRRERRASKLHGMTPQNRKRKRNKRSVQPLLHGS